MNNKYMELINKVQEEISNNNPNYKFTDECKRIEQTYYICLPEWIENHSLSNKVNSILDIGCAFGTLLLMAKELTKCDSLFGLEILKHLSDEIINKYNIEYEVMNIELQNVIFSKKKFDIILFTEVIEHLKYNPVYTMKTIHKLLSKNGRVFMSCPNQNVWGKLDIYKSYKDMPIPNGYKYHEDLGHEYHYNLDELKEIFNETKFEIVNMGYSPENVKSHFNFELKKK
jgi:2-polyprenyl-3-methyl-5-hydroxy-6-metoxy-1,4-benzoquinol methylase